MPGLTPKQERPRRAGSKPKPKAKPKADAPKRDTRFAVGNNFWQQRSTHGRKPIFATPDDLWDACLQYFAWVADNPLTEAQAFAYQGAVTIEPMPKMRAMTISGLCIFLDIDRETWSEYAKRPDYVGITTRAEAVIRTQKFEGASAGLLNANIIARDLGLAEKQEHTGKDGGAIAVEDATGERSKNDLARRIAKLLRKGSKAA